MPKSKKKKKEPVRMIGWLYFSTNNDYPPEFQTYNNKKQIVTYKIRSEVLKVQIVDDNVAVKKDIIDYKAIQENNNE
jgi:hypothetical protein